ncbi:hypothetical protein KI387_038431, partial [Taxus chinensis]
MAQCLDLISRQTLIFQHHLGPDEDEVNELFQRYDAYVARLPEEKDAEEKGEEEEDAGTKDDEH